MILQPPTDNLYKFMAIFGLIIWIGGTFYPLAKVYEMEKDLIEHDAQYAQAKLNPEQANMAILMKHSQQMMLTAKTVKLYAIIGWTSAIIGGFLMSFGFMWWYVRVQKPLDAQLSLASSHPTMPSTRRAKVARR